jgi:hypothetical protein
MGGFCARASTKLGIVLDAFCDAGEDEMLVIVVDRLPTCNTTGPVLMRLKMAMASSWLRPWRIEPLTARISSPENKKETMSRKI